MMSRIYQNPILALILSLSFSLLMSGCGTRGGKPDVRKEAASADSIPVQVAEVQPRDLVVTRTYSGTLEGEEQANIVAKISERITGIKVHVGEAVVAGQTVLTLDKSGPSSQYYQAEANFLNAEKNLKRMNSLYEEGAISQQSLDATQTAFDIAKANFEAARSSVELSSPISGVVTAVNGNVGDLATPGVVLMTVANISRMKVIFNVGEIDIPNLSIGQTIRIYSELRPDVIAQGRIVQLAKSADVRSRSFEVKALFPNTPEKWFKPGMFCKAEVPLVARKNSLAIPNAAILTDGANPRVFVVRHGRACSQSVKTGVSDGAMTEILQGLGKGDTVVTRGMNDLKDSSLVVVLNREGSPAR